MPSTPLSAPVGGAWRRLRGAGLLGLCLVPTVAGLVRLAELMAGGPVTAANARFLAAPLPMVVHGVASLVFALGGVVQLSWAPGGRGHRRLGWGLGVGGALAALSGLWMTGFYPTAVANFDGPVLYGIRLVVGCAMIGALGLGLRAAVRREPVRHRAWMLRAYALGLGAGTQVFTHIPWFVFPDLRGEALRAACMGAGWALNVVFAEWWIRRPRPSAGGTPGAG